MKKKKRTRIKLLTGILSAAMILSLIPMTGMAAAADQENAGGSAAAAVSGQSGQISETGDQVSNNSGTAAAAESKGTEGTAADSAADMTITTKCTNGTITPNMTVAAGGSATINYSVKTSTDPGVSFYLYRVMVDGAIKYIDADGNGTPEQGSAAVKESYTFSNVTEDHAISVIYMPVLPSGINSPADISVNGADDYWFDPFKGTDDLACTYNAAVYIPKTAQNLANMFNSFMRSLTATITGVYDPNIDATGATATMLNTSMKLCRGHLRQATEHFLCRYGARMCIKLIFQQP